MISRVTYYTKIIFNLNLGLPTRNQRLLVLGKSSDLSHFNFNAKLNYYALNYCEMTLLQPQRTSYSKASSKMWFSYVKNTNEFQHGLLGISNPHIAGNLCLQFPEEEPLKAKQIEVSSRVSNTFIGLKKGSRLVKYMIPLPSHIEPKRSIIFTNNKFWIDRYCCGKVGMRNNVMSKMIYTRMLQTWIYRSRSFSNHLPPTMSLGTGSIYYIVNAKIKGSIIFGNVKVQETDCLQLSDYTI